MRNILLLVLLVSGTATQAQKDRKVSTIDFVQVLNNNKAEALFYYENNWKILRERALAKNYIDSYQLLETPVSEDEPFELMLITTYANQEEYAHAEKRFEALIAEKGKLSLLNEKKPGEFRKVLFNKLATQLH